MTRPSLSFLRLRYALARSAYAQLVRRHGGAVVSWPEYRRSIAGLSVGAIRETATF